MAWTTRQRRAGRLGYCALALALTSVARMPAALSAEVANEPASSAANADWPLERVALHDGRVYRGLLRSETRQMLDFLQVERPAGAPMYVVGLRLRRSEIASVQRLEPSRHETLQERLEQFFRHARIEAEDLAAVQLRRLAGKKPPVFEFRDADFLLTSTADDLTTRQAVVRLRQYFAGFAQLLPQISTGTPVHIYLHATADEQRRHLADLQLPLDRTAVYLADRREIIAAADIRQLAAELTATRAEHEQIIRQYETLVAGLPERLREESRRLREQGASSSELRQLNLLTRRQLEDEVDRVRRTINDYERRNAAVFDEAAATLLATLAHEALHAWLDARFSTPRHELPRWLHEGLAQVFEASWFEAGQLRIDAPDPRRLALLQADLNGDEPLALAELLAADGPSWLRAHDDRDAAQRQYLYAWGVAWYLAVERGDCTADRLDALAAALAVDAPAAEAFARLSSMPLGEFEPRWREAMLALKPPVIANPVPLRTVPR
ncbi:MAG: DUF1570 domain-containing protein [Pirellulales bacterium]|nr:DUF1570 domain-containing protein [Pirellulales bacterium]